MRKFEDAKPACRDKGRTEPPRKTVPRDAPRHPPSNVAGLNHRRASSVSRTQDGPKKYTAQKETKKATHHELAKQCAAPCARARCGGVCRPCPCPQESDKRESQKKPAARIYIPPFPVSQPMYNPPPSVPKPPSAEPTRLRNPSWGEVLRENHTPLTMVGERSACDIHNPSVWQAADKPNIPSWSASRPQSHAYNYYQPSHDHRHLPSEETSPSTDNSSGFSSNTESLNYTDKSIQCSSTPRGEVLLARRVPRASSAVSYYEREGLKKRSNHKDDVPDSFEMYNPVRTLSFLVKELQDKLVKDPKENSSIHKILGDIEKVILRIPTSKDSKPRPTHKPPPQQAQQQPHRAKAAEPQHKTRPVSQPPPPACPEAPVRESTVAQPVLPAAEKQATVKAMETVPLLTQRLEEKASDLHRKLLEVMPPDAVPSPPSSTQLLPGSSEALLKEQLEGSCRKLEAMCEAMSSSFDELRAERDKFERMAAEKNVQLAELEGRHQDYEMALGLLRNNLDSTARRMRALTMENRLLQEQVKVLPALQARNEEVLALQKELERVRQENERLRQGQQQAAATAEEKCRLQEENKGESEAAQRALRESTERSEQLAQELQMLRLERERLLLMNHSKDEELTRFHQEIGVIKSLVVQQLSALRLSVQGSGSGRNPYLPTSTSISLSSSPLSNSSSDVAGGRGSRPASRPAACSSPTPSGSESGQVARSWDEISSIPADSNPETEVQVTLLPRELNESDASGFHSLALDASWPAPEAEPGQRPPSRRGGPRPPPPPGSTPRVAGTSSVATELQEHIMQLFSLCQVQSSNSRLGVGHPPSLVSFDALSLGPEEGSEDSVDILLARMDQGDVGQM